MRVLLVSPRFHGYWRSIADALVRNGHDVRAVPYDARGRAATAAHKLGHELPTRLGVAGRATGRHETSAAVNAVRAYQPSAVVVVRGDVLEQPFWDELDLRRLPRVVWLYDELRRTSWTADRLHAAGPLATYSALDAQALGARYLPLAFDPDLVGSLDPPVRVDEVVFVGARYPSRERVLLGLWEAGVPVRVFGRDWSRHPVDRLRTWGGRRPPVPAGRDLDRATAYRTMAAAVAALNLHGDQDGFTVRTFEASGVGGLQLIDRDDVDELYDPGTELLTFDSHDELLDHVAHARRDPGWADAIRAKGRARTLAEHTFVHRARVLEELWSTWH